MNSETKELIVYLLAISILIPLGCLFCEIAKSNPALGYGLLGLMVLSIFIGFFAYIWIAVKLEDRRMCYGEN